MESTSKRGKFYSISLLDEYKGAHGLNRNSKLEFNRDTLMKLDDFYLERKASNKIYARVVRDLGLDIDSEDVIEGLSAREFSITDEPFSRGLIATSDKRTLEEGAFEHVTSDRIVLANLKIYQGEPVFEMRLDSGPVESSLEGMGYKTIIRTNPFIPSIKFFDKVFELGKYDAIIGINGSISDLDYRAKHDAMDRLKQHMDRDFIYYEGEEDSSYYYVLASF